MVWVECRDAAISRRSTPKIVLSRKNFYFASKVAIWWIIVDILKYLYQLYVIMANSFLLEMEIAKDH